MDRPEPMDRPDCRYGYVIRETFGFIWRDAQRCMR